MSRNRKLYLHEPPVDSDMAVVTIILIRPILAVMPAITPICRGNALLTLSVPVIDGQDLVLVVVPALELLWKAVR